MLSNTRDLRAKLARDYRALVASIAIGYQGNGLTLQDLIQVHTHFSVLLCYSSFLISYVF